MQTENPIDKLFKEGLAGHRKDPPPHLWQNIAGAMTTSSSSSNGHRGNRKPFWWWGSLIALLVMVPVAWFTIAINTPGEEMPLYDNYIPTRNAEQSTADAKTESPSGTRIQPMHTPTAHQTMPQELNIIHKSTQTADPHATATPSPTLHDPYDIPGTSYHEVTEAPPVIQTEPASEPQYGYQQKTVATGTANLVERSPPIDPKPHKTTQTKTLITDLKATEETNTPPADSASGTLQATSESSTQTETITATSNLRNPLNLRYAWMLHTAARYDHARKAHTTSPPIAPEVLLSARLNHKRFTLESGVGMGWLYQNNPWEMVHRNVDTVGYYEYVTDVLFGPVYHPIDSTILGYAPVNIVTSTTPQLDTNTHVTYTDEKYRVGYLHVPLMIHYDLIVRDKFTLSAQTGVIYFRKIFEKQTRPQTPENKELIALLNKGIPANRHFWQYQAGLGLQYNSEGLWYTEASLLMRTPINDWYIPYHQDKKPASLVISIAIGRWF